MVMKTKQRQSMAQVKDLGGYVQEQTPSPEEGCGSYGGAASMLRWKLLRCVRVAEVVLQTSSKLLRYSHSPYTNLFTVSALSRP